MPRKRKFRLFRSRLTVCWVKSTFDPAGPAQSGCPCGSRAFTAVCDSNSYNLIRKVVMSRPCPCASNLTFDRCCEPYLAGRKSPETAEKLMRSRFTAYALARADYLAATTAAEEREKLDV